MTVGTINIALTGDSIIARKVSVHKDKQTKDLYNKLREADVAFTNLEVLPNDFQGHPAARSDGAHFAAHSYVLDDLQEIGFNLFSCANNHSLDYGVKGLLTTIEELESRNLTYAGIGKNLTEARMPVYYDTSGGAVAMLSCSSTVFAEDVAGDARPEVQGRPGSNPLRFDVEYHITKEQMDALKDIDASLGLEQHRKDSIQLGFRHPLEDKDIFSFEDSNLHVAETLNAKFRISDQVGVHTKANEKDEQEILKWVKEAKARADVVILSLHAHEQGEIREEAAEFIEQFAYQAIDAGASVVVMHGPHLLRGMELYKGKPIFYSLGNFIGHNELVNKLPQDSYDRFKVDPAMTPSEIFHKRSDGGKRGFPGDDLYWQSVMPICHFKDGRLNKIEIYPLALTNGEHPYQRGRPYLAEGERAKSIIRKFVELSTRYDTGITINESGHALVEL